MKPYYLYRNYLKKTYNDVLYRIPIDMGFNCPNRNNNKKGGCSFCPDDGARASQTKNVTTIEEQITQATRFAKDRYNAKFFMAYIQAFSASFDSQSQKKYQKILENNKFKAISFGTRPDCLNNQAYTYLSKLNKKIDVWVELGVQTTNEQTLIKINRGHTWQESKNAIIKLHNLGIKIATHIIIGLPGETEKDFIKTAKELSDLPIDAIKIHNLLVLKNTQIATEYQQKKFNTLNEHQYAEKLISVLRNIRKNLPIIRITTDAPDKDIIAPKWHMIKENFINHVIQKMINEEVCQGDQYENTIKSEHFFEPVKTEDNSITYFNDFHKEHYHSPAGAMLEANEKFVIPSKLENADNVEILDICFGLGYNSLSAMEHALKNNTEAHITALEYDKRVVGSASNHIKYKNKVNWNLALVCAYMQDWFVRKNCRLDMLWGDARYSITKLPEAKFDIVFLDAFSTQRNSELWTVDFFKQIKRVIKNDGILITYCAAIPVRSGLISAGFYVGETEPVGRPRGGTIASLSKTKIEKELPEQEYEMMKTTKGIPYRDPYLVYTNKEILRNRQNKVIEFKKNNPYTSL